MAWRAPYKTLCEMFPQVDVRIIKGTVLDHGSDISSAVDFIINEVLTPEELEATSIQLPQRVALVLDSEVRTSEPEVSYLAEAQQQQAESQPFSETTGENGADGGNPTLLLARRNCEDSSAEGRCTEQVPFVPGPTEELVRRPLSEIAVSTEQPAEEDFPSDSAHSSLLENLQQSVVAPGDTSQLSEQGSGYDNDRANALVARREEFSFGEHLLKLKRLLEADSLDDSVISSGASTASDAREWRNFKGYREVLQDTSDDSDVADMSDEDEHQNITANGSTSASSSGEDECFTKASAFSTNEDVKVDRISYNITDSPYRDSWPGSDSCPFGASELSKEENYSSVYSDLQDSPPSDAAMCGSLNSSSSQAASMDTLDQAFQKTKSDKDDLIAAIEGIRALRQQMEQADAAARQAKLDAANGGVDILAKAHALRELVAQRRQANEIHAGEVFGERAVLATEARELRSRLAQVMQEKTQAFNHVLQIKAMLQERVDTAIKQREAAEAEKLEKETKAMEVLTLEQAAFEKVEQDTRELETEAEACTKLREFLIDRGSAVDSIQGEVAILCEDVDVLKQHVEGSAVFPHSGSIQGSSLSSSSKSSWNSVGLELSAVGSSKSCRNSLVQIAPGVVDDANQTVECSSGDSNVRTLADTASLENWENSASAPCHSGNMSGSYRDSKAIPDDWRPYLTPRSRVISWTQVNPDQEATTHILPVISAAGHRACVDAEDQEIVERLAYEARMAILPGASEFGSPKDKYDLFRAAKSKPAVDDGWHLLDSSCGSSCSSSSSGHSDC